MTTGIYVLNIAVCRSTRPPCLAARCCRPSPQRSSTWRRPAHRRLVRRVSPRLRRRRRRRGRPHVSRGRRSAVWRTLGHPPFTIVNIIRSEAHCGRRIEPGLASTADKQFAVILLRTIPRRDARSCVEKRGIQKFVYLHWLCSNTGVRCSSQYSCLWFALVTYGTVTAIVCTFCRFTVVFRYILSRILQKSYKNLMLVFCTNVSVKMTSFS